MYQRKFIFDRASRSIKNSVDWQGLMTITDPETGKQLEYRALMRHPKYKDIWVKSLPNEFGRLEQGVGGRVEGTNMIRASTLWEKSHVQTLCM